MATAAPTDRDRDLTSVGQARALARRAKAAAPVLAELSQQQIDAIVDAAAAAATANAQAFARMAVDETGYGVYEHKIQKNLFASETVYRFIRPMQTVGIVARDPETGEVGVAVQSHWFSVGSVVSWARAGVGAVATQSIGEPSYGPNLLALLEQGVAPAEALARLTRTR